MATELKKIVLRRGTGTPPTDLAEGELAFQTDTDKLFVGTGLASPNHYKQVANLADMGVTATNTELNKLASSTVTAAELNKLAGFTGVVADLNYAKDLRATGVTDTEFDYLDGVTSNIQDQFAAVNASIAEVEWIKEAEVNYTQGAGVDNFLIDNSIVTFNMANYDYKVVLDYSGLGSGTSEFKIRINDDSTAGKHTFITRVVKLTGASATALGVTEAGEYGATSTFIPTYLGLGSGVTQGAIGYLQAEFTISQSLVSSGGFEAYIVRGSGSVITGEGPQATNTTYSLSASSNFTGSFSQVVDAGNITSIRIFDLPEMSAETVKIRIYKRSR